MAVETRWVRYGRDAAEALRAEIVAAKGTEPLSPVTVVVPSNHVGVSVRRTLASGRLGPTTSAPSGIGLVAVTFLTGYRLAELLGAPVLAGQDRRPVSIPVLTAAVRAALADDPGMFAPVSEHPATESALVASYRELRDLTDVALRDVASRGRRAADVVRLHRTVRARLETDWYDEEDLMQAAAGVIASGRAPSEVGAVIVYLPQRVTLHTAELLGAIARDGEVSVIVGATGDDGADEEVLASIDRIGAGRPDPGRRPHADLPLPVTEDRTTILVSSDADEEVREAVRIVVDEARAGTPLDRIALLYATPEPYDRLVREHLAAAGIALNGSAGIPVAARLVGRTLLQLLQLPEGHFRRQELFTWLASAPIRHEGRWAPSASWERLSREAGVVGGRAHWDDLLAALAERRRLQVESAAEDDEDLPEWRVDQWRRQERGARELRTFVISLMDRLEAAARTPASWSARADWARQLLTDLLGGPELRASWPPAERKAAERVDLALDRLAALDEIESTVDLEVFTRTLTVELESDLGRVGRLGEGVLIGSIAMGLGTELDLLITLGMAEGSFPAPVRDDSLLPDAERAAAEGSLSLRRDQVDRHHRELIVCLAASERQVLSVPRGDLRRSSDRVPSRWVLDVASQLAGSKWWAPDLWRAKEPWVRSVASFDAGVRALSFPATGQEHRLRSVLAAGARRSELAAVGGAIDDDLGRAISVLDHRESSTFTRFDGNLAGLAIPSPVERGASATSLQRWAVCPYAYALQDLLRVEPVENPEEEIQLTPMDRGSLVHEVLEVFLEEVLAADADVRHAWSEAQRDRLAEIAAAVCDRYAAEGRTGRELFWRRDRPRLLHSFQRFADEDDGYRARARTRPVATELPFGLDAAPPVHFPLPDGRTVPMRGRADRIDVAEDGRIHVLDYKTGRIRSEKELSPENPHLNGSRLQLPVYALAALQHQGSEGRVRADYWFVTSREGYKQIGYEVTPEILDAASQAVGLIVDGIEAGVFVPRPVPPAPNFRIDCRFCDPDGLGTADLYRQWERKMADPALSGYLALVAPPEDGTEP